MRGEMKIPPATTTDLYIIGANSDPNFSILKNNGSIISALVRTQSVQFHTDEPKVGLASTSILEGLKIIIPIPEQMVQQEKARLLKEKDRLSANLEKVKLQLDNAEFVKNAPPQLIEKQKQ